MPTSSANYTSPPTTTAGSKFFGVAPDNTIWHTWQIAPGGDWHGSWNELYNDTDQLRELYVASNHDGRLEVFGVAPNNTIWHTWQIAPGGDWHGSWNELYNDTDQLRELCVASNHDGRLEVFGVAPDNTIWHTWQIAAGQWLSAKSRIGHFDLQGATLAMAGVHAAMLHNGRVLYFSYDPNEENTLERAFWQLWNPVDDAVTPVRVHSRNLFCAGHCFLGDGRLLVSGGQSYNWFPWIHPGADHDVHTFNPETNTWARHEDMPGARWYPTCVTLPSGDGLMAGGHAVRYRPVGAINNEYENFQWQTDQKTQPRAFNPGHIDAYPFLCVLPDGTSAGTLFAFSRREARLFSLENQTWTGRFPTASQDWRTYNRQGAFVLLPLLPGESEQTRIMVFGGGGPGSKATSTAEIFEFNQADPSASVWRRPAGGDMAFQRFMSDAVLLPDGTVLVVNGAAEGVADDSKQPVMAAELFNPRDESWHTLALLNRPRQYHSAALLLPDARVVISGHTEHWNPGHKFEETTLDVYSPPYLFKGRRPTIDSAPSKMSYGTQYNITTTGDVASVALLRAGSTTHTNNMDQRHVGLLLRREDDQLVVTAPPSGTVAPPGYYMLFVVGPGGVPSIAKWVLIAGDAL
ncbi:copper radical oxidase [Cenococcum geophilum]